MVAVPVFLYFVVVVASVKTQHENYRHYAVETHTHIYSILLAIYIFAISFKTMCAATVKFTFVPLICRQLNRAMSEMQREYGKYHRT